MITPNLQIALISKDKYMFPMSSKYTSSFNLNCFSKDYLVLKCFSFDCVKHLAPSSGKTVDCSFIAVSVINKGTVM